MPVHRFSIEDDVGPTATLEAAIEELERKRERVISNTIIGSEWVIVTSSAPKVEKRAQR